MTKHGTGVAWTHFEPGYLGVPEWRGETWNPVVGCTPAPGSEQGGCRNCYARVLHDQRHKANVLAARHSPAGSSSAHWAHPYSVVRRAREQGHAVPMPPQYDRPFAKVQMLTERVDGSTAHQPLRWKKPRAVFVCSMADLFHPDVTDEFLDRVFAVMALRPQHVFMVLTKRPDRMREYVESKFEGDGWIEAATAIHPDWTPEGLEWPLPNFWAGASIETQPMMERRLPDLLGTPAPVHFISAEPLLGPIDFIPWTSPYQTRAASKPDWIIVGGESGGGHRYMETDWARTIYRDCQSAGVAYFGKQRSDTKSGRPIPSPYDLRQWPGQWPEITPKRWREGA